MAPDNTLQAERSDISSDPDTSTQVKYVVPGKYYPMLNVGKEEIGRQQQQGGGWDGGEAIQTWWCKLSPVSQYIISIGVITV